MDTTSAKGKVSAFMIEVLVTGPKQTTNNDSPVLPKTDHFHVILGSIFKPMIIDKLSHYTDKYT